MRNLDELKEKADFISDSQKLDLMIEKIELSIVEAILREETYAHVEVMNFLVDEVRAFLCSNGYYFYTGGAKISGTTFSIRLYKYKGELK